MTRHMRTGQPGVELIKSFEGFHARAVPTGPSGWVIGYGHTKAARAGLKVRHADAEAVLREYDLPPIERAIEQAVLAPLNQNEFDALASFVFNIGCKAFEASAVLAHLNAGERLQAAEAMTAWRVAEINGEVVLIDALVRRRAAESALFLTTPGARVLAPTAKITPLFDQTTIPAGLLRAAIPLAEDTEDQDDLFGGEAEPVLSPLGIDEDEDDLRPGRIEPRDMLRPTATEEAARAVTERLTRILGEPPLTEPPAVPRIDEPTPDEIARAISALADPIEELAPVETETPPAPNGEIAIDDLAPVDIDPASIEAAIEREKAYAASSDVGALSIALYATMLLLGVVLTAFGLSGVFAALSRFGAADAGQQWTSFGLTLLGGLLTVMAVYFAAKSRFWEQN